MLLPPGSLRMRVLLFLTAAAVKLCVHRVIACETGRFLLDPKLLNLTNSPTNSYMPCRLSNFRA